MNEQHLPSALIVDSSILLPTVSTIKTPEGRLIATIHAESPEELQVLQQLFATAPRTLRALDAITEKYKTFREVEQNRVTKEIIEALECIIQVTVPRPPGK